MTREQWRAVWRAQRIVLRELAKARDDMMLFGTSFVKHGNGGAWQRDGSDIARRVPPSAVYAGE